MPEIKDIIYGAGILLTFAVGVWNLIFNYRTTRKTSFVNTVTSQRIKWIEQFRQDLGALCGLTHTWCNTPLPSAEAELEILKEIDRLRVVIQLRLNPKGVLDQKILALVLRIRQVTHESQRREMDSLLTELNNRA